VILENSDPKKIRKFSLSGQMLFNQLIKSLITNLSVKNKIWFWIFNYG